MRLTRPLREKAPLLSTVIVADDLTGACDSAAVFATFGIKARVALDVGHLQPAQPQVVSYSLEMRNLQADKAVQRMQAAKHIFRASADVLFCKIDSAGRGPVEEGVLNIMNLANCGWAVVTPAFPDQGRTVKHGVLEIAENGSVTRQVPMERLFPNGSQALLARISAGDAEDRGRQMKAALDAGRRILFCDAETRWDLAAIVEAAQQIDHGRVLWCGSAGLARALAACFSPTGTKHANYPPTKGEKCIVFAGTPHQATADQINALAENERVVQIECTPGNLAFSSDSGCIVATVRCGETSEAQVREVWRHVKDTGEARALVLTGGDTASLVLRALAAESILMQGEIASGIPWGVIEGGMADGYRVVTKSGGFGTRTALVEIVQFLERMS